MRFLQYALIIPAMFLAVHTSQAATILGKVMVYTDKNTNSELYPLVSGNKMEYTDRSVIRFSGGTLVADKGSVIKAEENGETIVFKVQKGDISFRIQPEKTRVTFITPQGELRTPQVIKISTGYISGVLMVSDTTVVKVIEGEMDAVTFNGTTIIREGEAFVLSGREIAQSDVQSTEPAGSESEIDNSATGADEGTNVAEPDEVLEAMSELPVNLLDLLGMVGNKGIAQTPLVPDGNIRVESDDNPVKAKLVDYAMQTSDSSLPAGKDVKIVCVSADQETKEQTLLVRSYDSFYPEKLEEKSLIETTVRSQGSLSPRGMSEFVEYVPGRSNKGWTTVVVDGNMQPDPNGGIAPGTNLEVVCIQSTLVLQPIDIVNEKYLNLVGKTVTTQTPLEPSGQVALANADSSIMQAMLVDLNLGPVEGYSIQVNTNLTVVGVKETPSGPLLLVQEPQNVLGEVNYAVGQTVTSTKEISQFGIVNLKNGQWYAQVVGANFQTASATFPAGTVFKVVSVNTALLVNTGPALVAMFAPAVVAPAAFFAGAGGAAIVATGAAATTVILVPVIASDNGGNGGATNIQPTP